MNTVKLYLSELKANKATGYDMLPSKLLKTTSDILCQSVCYLINMSIKGEDLGCSGRSYERRLT